VPSPLIFDEFFEVLYFLEEYFSNNFSYRTFRHLKIRALLSLETSISDYPLTQRHIPEETNSQLNFCLKLKEGERHLYACNTTNKLFECGSEELNKQLFDHFITVETRQN